MDSYVSYVETRAAVVHRSSLITLPRILSTTRAFKSYFYRRSPMPVVHGLI